MPKEMTCGEYLRQNREELARLSPGDTERTREVLSNIYAVSYQMNFDEPERAAESAPLQREQVESLAGVLRERSPELRAIAEDAERRGRAVKEANRGNGLPLMRLVIGEYITRKTELARLRAAQKDRQQKSGRRKERGKTL